MIARVLSGQGVTCRWLLAVCCCSAGRALARAVRHPSLLRFKISNFKVLKDKISPQSSESYSESEGPSSESENSTATLRARIVATSERPWKSQTKIKIPFINEQVPNVIYLSFLVLFILFSFCLLQRYSIPVKKQIIKKRHDMKENEMIILSTFTDPACFQK